MVACQCCQLSQIFDTDKYQRCNFGVIGKNTELVRLNSRLLVIQLFLLVNIFGNCMNEYYYRKRLENDSSILQYSQVTSVGLGVVMILWRDGLNKLYYY